MVRAIFLVSVRGVNMDNEIIELNGVKKAALVKEIEIRDGKGSGRISLPVRYIGNKYKMYLVDETLA